MQPLDEARTLDALGLNVFPAPGDGSDKQPTVKWRDYQQRRASDRLEQWFRNDIPANLWVMCGRISGVVVLDCDSDAADDYWRGLLSNELLDNTVCSQTRKGHHYWFSIENTDLVPSWSIADEQNGLYFDVRAEGAGVIAPPSVHNTGFIYDWVRSPTDWDMEPLPPALRSAQAAGLRGANGQGGGDAPRSMLAKLLADPPEAGGRNVWLSRVAGHYAKLHRNMQDLYRVEVYRANEMLAPPLDELEFFKTTNSIWDSEQDKNETEGKEANEDNGWLTPGGVGTLHTPVRFKAGEEWVVELRQWANFDLQAVGVVEDENADRTYDVRITRKRQQDTLEALLPAKVLSDPRRLDAWLAEFGVGCTPPAEKEMTKTRGTVRLQQYLEAQDPPHFSVVPALGWASGGFICHEGVITAQGLQKFDGLKPDPILRNRAPYTYGFGSAAEAQKVLNEVLTFHAPQVASVFGAWWAACLLKPQLQAVSSQFPFMALEAPSESGKTTGMFAKLIQLNGNQQGQTSYTPASLRNAIAAHHSGIVWVDDEDSLDHLMQLLRMATGEGSYTKMGEDHHSAVTVRLVSPILVSGEALNMGTQKALRDRAVMLNVPSPTERRSVGDRERPQWDDIVALTTRHPDLSVFAGTMVQAALSATGYIDQLPRLRGSTGKRFGDKIAILRVGARVLSSMTGDPGHVDEVDTWVDEQHDHGAENALTLKILPEILATLQWPSEIVSGYGDEVPTPVVYKPTGAGHGLWFSTSHVALWWERRKHGRVEQRTETRSALEQQARALGILERKIRTRISGTDVRPTYWRIPDEIADLVLTRSHGGTVSGVETDTTLRKGTSRRLSSLGDPGCTSHDESPSDHAQLLPSGDDSE